MNPTVISSPLELFSACEQERKKDRRIGFVPTMGALHEGHLSLVDLASQHADFSVVSIFVNPTQFGPNEDFDRYPRNLDADLDKLSEKKVDVVFAPRPADMYPAGFSTKVVVSGVSQGLCGEARPGHFDGVALVVAKLFCAVGPCVAVFGRKDFQQLQVIKRLVGDLNLPVTILEGKTFREVDGLAMSSRNVYLSKDERARAHSVPEGLSAAHQLFQQGERASAKLLSVVSSRIAPAADAVQYITAADPRTLVPLSEDAPAPEQLLIAVAANFGATRLIDNIVLGEDEAPIR